MTNFEFFEENRNKICYLNEDSDIINEVANYVTSDVSLEDCVIVFPNRRAIHYLYSKFSEYLKNTFRSPLVYSIDDFVDNLYEQGKQSYRKINLMEAIYLLFNLLNGSEKYESFSKIHNSFDEFIPWGKEFFKDFEELFINKVNFDAYEKIINFSQNESSENFLINKVFETDFSYRMRDFFVLYRDFYSEIEGRLVSTRATRYNFVSKVSLPEKNFVIGGFYSLNESEKELFSNILNNKESRFFVKKSSKFCDLKNKKFYIFQSQTLNGQILKLRELLEQKKPLSSKDLILLVSEASLFPVLYNAIPDGERYNVSMGYPLSRTPIYSLFDMIATLLSRINNFKFYSTDYINLLFHPYVKTLKFDKYSFNSEESQDIQNLQSTVTRTLFQKIHAYIRNNNKIFISLKEIEEKSEIYNDVIDTIKSLNIEIGADDDFKKYLTDFLIEVHSKIVRAFLSVKNLSDFTGKINELLDYISEKSLGNLNLYGSNFFRYAYETVFELQSSEISGLKSTGHSQYFNLLRFFMQNARIPFSSSILDGIQILGSLETRNINFERVFYIDISDDNVPNVIKEMPFLTQDIRQILNLPTAKDNEDLQKANFVSLINGANEINFFYSNSVGKSLSRFVESIIWELQKINRSIEMPIPKESINFPISFTQENPGPIEKNDEILKLLESFEFSPSSIDKYLRCPLSFYYSYVLNLKEHKKIEEDISSSEIGNVVHEILFLYFKQWLGKEFANVNFDNEMNFINSFLDEKFQDNHSKEVLLQKEQCRLALKRVLEKNIRELNGMKILYLEKEFKSNIFCDNKKIKLKGRVDRIHELKSEYFLIDYKTGAAKIPKQSFLPNIENRNTWYENIRSFQLPFYVFLFEDSEKVDFKTITSGIWSLRNIDNEEYFQFDDDKHSAYHEALKYLISEILSIDIPFLPVSNKIEEKCAFCLYQTICSRQWVKSRKFS
ncbi:PD-(D/E)XK nuclease family protein [Thermodesulfobium sp. 4217-1]|uniref:PD-(D/E)XK nuclease family protein n=1 Tax=Thermodesulfobium sp. 4217-1 TaxID=3120013 RepID=UPI0032214A61